MASFPSTLCNAPPIGTEGTPYTHTFGSPPGAIPPFQWIINGSLPPGLVLNSATGQVTGTPTQHGEFGFNVLFGDSSPGPPHFLPSTCSIIITFTLATAPQGGRPYQVGPPVECNPPNEYDRCLDLDQPRLLKIQAKPACSVPQDLWTRVPWDPEFGSLPALAVPFKAIHSVPTPASAAGDVLVTRLIVPIGWDGLLTGIFWRYNGINFVDGSGDIFWRVQLNGGVRFVKDLGNVGFTLGSSVTPMPMTEGQQLQSGQQVSILVNVPNTSGGIQTGSSTITAGLIGFFWPKGVPGWTSR